MADVTMPQLGETVTEGTITKWFKQVGEQVAEDEVLFEVSTDKVDSEVPSPVSGYLTEIRAPEGETVDVGEVIAVVGDAPPAEGEAPTGAAQSGESEPAESESAAQPPAEPAPEATPAPATPAPASPQGDVVPSESGATGLLMSPLVRRLVDDHGLDPDELAGTGVGGRITRADVQAVIDARRSTPAPPSRSTPAAGPGAPTPPARSGRRPAPRPAPATASGDSVEPLNNIRRRTGEHMVASKATSPHAVTVVEVDYEGVDRVRAVERSAWQDEEGFGLTYLPFIARAVVDALRSYPHINSSVGNGELVVHHDVNLGIAVDLDFEGLLAPVIRGADQMRLRGIARSVHDLAERARSRQLSADDITGGTFTISNSGSFGTHLVLPIINQPQVAILSTDGIRRRPVVVTAADGTEAIAIHSVGLLAMSWDHRAFDGAYAAAFLRDVAEILETRDWSAEL